MYDSKHKEEDDTNSGSSKAKEPTVIGYVDKVNDDKLKVATGFGEFSQEYFGSVYMMGDAEAANDEREQQVPVGVNMYMTFTPNDKVTDAKKFGFIQRAKYTADNSAKAPEKGYTQYAAADKSFIDQDTGKMNPLYATDHKHKLGQKKDIEGYKDDFPVRNARKHGKDTRGGDVLGRKKAGHGEFGEQYTEANKLVSKPATFQDTPDNLNFDKYKQLKYEFETTIVAFSGSQAGMYFGCVNWGFEIKKTTMPDPDSPSKNVSTREITGISITKSSDAVPGKTFFDAAEAWNASKKFSGRKDLIEVPLGAGDVISEKAHLFQDEKNIEGDKEFTELSKDTHCMLFGSKLIGKDKKEYTHVRIEKDGKPITGWVETKLIQKTQ